MIEQHLLRLLRSIGLRTFVEYYAVFSDTSLTNEEAADRIPSTYTASTRRTRVSRARRIIGDGRSTEAFEFISRRRASIRRHRRLPQRGHVGGTAMRRTPSFTSCLLA